VFIRIELLAFAGLRQELLGAKRLDDRVLAFAPAQQVDLAAAIAAERERAWCSCHGKLNTFAANWTSSRLSHGSAFLKSAGTEFMRVRGNMTEGILTNSATGFATRKPARGAK